MLDLSGLANAEVVEALGKAIYLLIWLEREGRPGPQEAGWAPLFGGHPVPWERAQEDLGVSRSQRYQWARLLRAAGLIRELPSGEALIASHVLASPEFCVSGNPDFQTHTKPEMEEDVSGKSEMQNDAPPSPPAPPSFPNERDQEQEEQEEGRPDAPLHWRDWYDRTFIGKFPVWKHADVIDKAIEGGMEHAVAIRAIQSGLDLGKRDPLSWGASVVANLFAAGVRTLADAEEFELQQGEEESRRARTRADPRQGRGQQAASGAPSTVPARGHGGQRAAHPGAGGKAQRTGYGAVALRPPE